MSNPVIQAMLDRRSIRAYRQEPVSKETLDCILDCAINAPSARNKQPWHLTVTTDRQWLADMNKAIIKGVLAEDPAQEMPADKDYFHNAPMAIFVSSKDGESGADIGMLTQNVLLAAHALGLGTCVIGMARYATDGEDGARFLADLKLPGGYIPHYAIVLGHPAEAPDAKERDASKVTIL